jgi:hypothetical protein
LKKDLIEHENHCTLVKHTCPDCNLTYLKLDAAELHTDKLCLEKQLKDVRNHSQGKTRKLENDLEEYKRELIKVRQDCKEHTQQLTTMRKIMCK